MPPSSVEKEGAGDRWPVVMIYANGRVSDRSVFNDVHYVDPPEQTYYPADSPNVLTPEEARLIARFEIAVGQFDHEEWERASRLRDRISTWAEGEESK